jgi:hypothetical protein
MIGIVSPIQSARYRFAWEQWLSPIPVRFLNENEATSFQGSVIDHGGLYPEATLSFPIENRFFWEEDFIDIEQWRKYLETKSFGIQLPEGDFLLAVFYLYARLDEYFPEHRDDLGRFQAKHAVQTCWSGVQIPYLDFWRKSLLDKLKMSDPYVPRKILTVDVDSAFAFSDKGWYRTFGGFLKDVLGWRISQMWDRFQVIFFGKKDPYNTYDWIQAMARESDWQLMYFLLVADFNRYDIGLPFEQKKFREWMKDLAKSNVVGWHPGFASHDDDSKWKMEWERINQVVGRKVDRARMHYLKMQLPTTYRQLVESEISQDFTMGFAETIGFRAGTSRPFFWFDWMKNQQQSLQIVPFCYMEHTLHSYMKCTPSQAIEKIAEIKSRIKESNGDCCILWHNSSVSEYGEWEGWRTVLLHTLKD